MCLTADPGVASLIPAWSNTFAVIDHVIMSTAIILPSSDLRWVFSKLQDKVYAQSTVNRLVKLAQEKQYDHSCCLGR